MPKLVYVYGDDKKMLNTLVSSLRSNGYSIEYTNISDDLSASHIKADIALVCKPINPSTRITLGGLTVVLDNMAAYDDSGNNIHFTPTEFAMLTYLMKNASRAVPRSELLPTVWGFQNDASTRVADDTVKRLRKKLQNTNLSIETIWGYGFKVRELQNS